VDRLGAAAGIGDELDKDHESGEDTEDQPDQP